MRSNGDVRFLRISTAIQLKIVAVLLLVGLIWLIATGMTLLQRVNVERERAALGARAAAVAKSAGRVEAFRNSVDGIAERLERRQHLLDKMVRRYFGRFDGQRTQPVASNQALPETVRLAKLEKRQIAFANRLSAMADARSDRAEHALRHFGVVPGNASPRFREVSGGEGGPLIPLSQSEVALLRLSSTLTRLDRLERMLVALPSTFPAMPVLLSSSFGVRSDPFTHGAAMHAGLDIKGSRGQPIYAAAAGRVVRVGPWSGYGNVVVIDHGQGIETRYGHLSGFTVRPGAVVHAGDQIARMGSTGRSTGNHLHFEVRINGRAVNPQPFLEASADVLEIKAGARRRFTGGLGRS